MSLDPQKIVEFETVIPTCIQALSSVMPGIHAILRDDLVLIYSTDYPSADTNRAFLLRQAPEKIESLIDEVIAYFKEKNLPTTIMVSPGCAPTDLPQRLLKRGFVRQEPDECWLMLEHIKNMKVPRTDSRIAVRLVTRDDLGVFVETMVAAYEMNPDWIPALENMLEPSIGLPDINNYLAFIDDKPVATVTTMHHKEYVVVGSGGVLPQHRGTNLLYNLAVVALAQARDKGADTILAQTTVGPKFERFLRICGLKQAFKRQGYILE
jgi:hypothetical protein